MIIILSFSSFLSSVPGIVLCALLAVGLVALLILVGKKHIERHAERSRKLKNLKAKTDETLFLKGKLAGLSSRLHRSVEPDHPEEPMPKGVEEGTNAAVSESLRNLRDSLPETIRLSVTDLALNKVADKTANKIQSGEVESSVYDPDTAREVQQLIETVQNEAEQTPDKTPDAAPVMTSAEAVGEPIVQDEEPSDEEPETTPLETVESTEAEPTVRDEEPSDEDSAPVFAGKNLTFIDPEKDPEAYAQLLADVAAGKKKLVTKARKNFRSSLIQADAALQSYHSDIKNELLKYKGISCRESRNYEAFRCGQNQVAKMICKGKTLQLYLAIDPSSLDVSGYSVTDVSEKKKFAATPTLLKIKGDRKFKYAKELANRMCQELFALQLKKNFVPTDESFPYMTDEELAKAGLLKILYAGEPIDNASEQ